MGVRSGGVTDEYTGSHWDSPGVLIGTGGISGAMGIDLRALGKLWGFRGQAVFLKAGFSPTPHLSWYPFICGKASC